MEKVEEADDDSNDAEGAKKESRDSQIPARFESLGNDEAWKHM